MTDTSTAHSATRVPREKSKRTTSTGTVKPGTRPTKPGKKVAKPQVSRPAKRPSAKKAPARKPAKADRASVSTGKGISGLPGTPIIYTLPRPQNDFQPVDKVRVKNPNDNGKWIDTLKLIGRGKTPGNSYVARELQSDGDGPLAGKHNNRGCAHAWLGQVDKARAAFVNAINEAKKMSGGAKIRKTAEYNLFLLTR
jgi:hypothetical protein